jgi:hypothetical protein
MKLSSYQKLKAKNAELEKEINTLVIRPDSVDALLIKSRKEFVQEQALVGMFGERLSNKFKHSPGTFIQGDGFVKFVVKQQ